MLYVKALCKHANEILNLKIVVDGVYETLYTPETPNTTFFSMLYVKALRKYANELT